MLRTGPTPDTAADTFPGAFPGSLPVPFGISTTISAAVSAAAVVVTLALPPDRTATRFAVLLLAAAVAGLVTADPLAAALVAVATFAVFDGFEENRSGELGWHAGDLQRLLTLVALAAAGGLLARGLARLLAWRRQERRFAELTSWACAQVPAASGGTAQEAW